MQFTLEKVHSHNEHTALILFLISCVERAMHNSIHCYSAKACQNKITSWLHLLFLHYVYVSFTLLLSKMLPH